MWKEFRAFIMRGNVMDLAIAVIIGGAFGKVVTSLVNDIIMPPIGLALGKVDFSNLYVNLSSHHYASLADAEKAGAPTINYGLFINNVLNFIIIAFCIFIFIEQANRRYKKRTAKPVEVKTKKCTFCQTDIPILATRCPNCTSQLEGSSSVS